jgi:hypothetical protein
MEQMCSLGRGFTISGCAAYRRQGGFAEVVGVDAELCQDCVGVAVVTPEQTEQDVLAADGTGLEPDCFTQRQLKGLLRRLREARPNAPRLTVRHGIGTEGFHQVLKHDVQVDAD